jgi:hypothetical protein
MPDTGAVGGAGGRGLAPKPDVVLSDPRAVEAFMAGLAKTI